MTARTLSLALAACALCLALALSAYWYLAWPGGVSVPRVGAAAIGGAFALTDHTGKARTQADFAGKHLLVQFGYTFCPDVCPTELQKAAAVLEALGGEADKLQVLFVSIDPARDTPAVLADYVSAFHPAIVGLTGSAEQVHAAARAYKVYYAKGEDTGDGGYLMDHSTFTYFMDPAGRYLRHFSASNGPEEMARQIAAAL